MYFENNYKLMHTFKLYVPRNFIKNPIHRNKCYLECILYRVYSYVKNQNFTCAF